MHIYNWVQLCKHKFTSDYIKYDRSPNSIKDMLQCFHALNCFSLYSDLAIVSASRSIPIITIEIKTVFLSRIMIINYIIS
jgi:hypothetical protein